MNWMQNKYAPDYKRRIKAMSDSIDRVYDALKICRSVPSAPPTRRYDLDKGKVVHLGR